jgi:hypothetical protein
MLQHREILLSSQAFYDAVVDTRLVIRQDAWLTAAMRAAAKLGSGDA